MASDGTTAAAVMSWSNYNIRDGGEFALTTGPLDHHSSNYWHLNSGCANHYLYSFSLGNNIGDAGYDVNTGLGAWSATRTCDVPEGGGLAFYAAVR